MAPLLDFILNRSENFRRARLPSLYSDFSLHRYTNPDGFDINVYAWYDVLRKAAWDGLLPPDTSETDILSLTVGEELLSALETDEWGRPQALGTVMDEAVSRRWLVSEREFQLSSVNFYDRSLLSRSWGLFSWGFRKLGLPGVIFAPVGLESRRFIIVSNVENAAGSVLSHMAYGNPGNRVYSFDDFRKEASRAISSTHQLTDQDLKILLKHLARDKQSLVFDDVTKIVKFRVPEQNVSTITKEDIAIVTLKTLINNLHLQCNQLTSQISDFSDAARTGVKMRNQLSAIRALRSKKLAEQSLARKITHLSHLEGAYDRIEQAIDQVALIGAMKSTTQVLRELHSGTGKFENVENVVEEFQNEILKSDGIGDVIKASQGTSAVDEETIEAELELLIHHAELSNNDKQAQDVAARLDSIKSLEKISPALEAKQINNTLISEMPIRSVKNQEDLLEYEASPNT